MNNIKEVKGLNNQQVSARKDHVKVLRDSIFGRNISIDRIFNLITIDGNIYYEFKCSNPSVFWRDDDTYDKLYKYNSTFMGFYFRNNQLPKRCEPTHTKLNKGFIEWLKIEGKQRVSASKSKLIVKHFIKHISRLHYHNKFTILYTRRKTNWKEFKTLSHEYAMLFIDYLISLNVVTSFLGYSSGLKVNAERTSSMLIFKPDFILECNGKIESKVNIDECLKTSEDKPLIKINERYGKGKLKRTKILNKEEKIMAEDLGDMMSDYRSLLQNSMIEVNGTLIPEIFFTRVFNEDFKHGGRFFDDGSIQQQSKPIRETIKIDREPTVELDFKSLHYAFAAEELGLDLLYKDPYDFDYEITLCQESVKEWEDKFGIKYYYDSVRNIKKTALLIMFNAKNMNNAIKGISKALLDDYKKEDKSRRRFVGIKDLKVKPLIQAVIAHNPEVKDYFMSGVGTRFQNLDSNIMDYCVREFIKVNQVCLPVHDSLIVKESLIEFTTKCMEDGYEHVMGSRINCKVE